MIKKRIIKVIKWIGIILAFSLVIGLFFPTWTPKIVGDNSISKLQKIKINNANLEVMIRGNDRNNPIIVFVHGGPCCSEIPYVRKYQDLLEKKFTIVQYDQRGSGKSYEFGKDYSSVNASIHADDLIALTEYIEKSLHQDQVILIGHSYGTYVATLAAAKRPELYRAYVGIGQLADTVESELNTLHKCIEAAKTAGNEEDVTYLSGLENSISQGERMAPRNYVRKYGFAARNIDENADYMNGFLFGSEYNLLDTIRFYKASSKYQEPLIREVIDKPISDLVTELDLPVYFVMGKYDGMTSPEAAEKYLDRLKGDSTQEIILFENSAHYPQFEEKEKFFDWMCSEFLK